MGHASSLALGAGSGLVVPSNSDEEAVRLERVFVARMAEQISRRVAPLGLRNFAIEGNSEHGWLLSAKMGDGRRVETYLDVNETLRIPDCDDWGEQVIALGGKKVLDAAELIARPPPEPPDRGIMVSQDRVGVELGEQIKDKLGKYGLEEVNEVIRGGKD